MFYTFNIRVCVTSVTHSLQCVFKTAKEFTSLKKVPFNAFMKNLIQIQHFFYLFVKDSFVKALPCHLVPTFYCRKLALFAVC